MRMRGGLLGAAALAVALVISLSGCSAFAPTITRVSEASSRPSAAAPTPRATAATPAAAARTPAASSSPATPQRAYPLTWVGQDSVGATMAYPYYLSLTFNGTHVGGTAELAIPAGATGAVSVEHATVTGTLNGNHLAIMATDANDGWQATASGTITLASLDLTGTLMGAGATQDGGSASGEADFTPGTASDFLALEKALGAYVASRNQARDSGCPESGCPAG